MDSDHDGNIVLNEFMTTLIDWSQLQKDSAWQVGLQYKGGAVVLHVRGLRYCGSAVQSLGPCPGLV